MQDRNCFYTKEDDGDLIFTFIQRFNWLPARAIYQDIEFNVNNSNTWEFNNIIVRFPESMAIVFESYLIARGYSEDGPTQRIEGTFWQTYKKEIKN